MFFLSPPRRKEFDPGIQTRMPKAMGGSTAAMQGCKALIWVSEVNPERIGVQQPKSIGSLYGQATKGSRWIPWHTEAMKDVVTCDKSRGAGNTL